MYTCLPVYLHKGNLMTITKEAVLAALSKVQEPELHKDLVTLNMIRNLEIEGDKVSFTVMLTTPACPLRSQIDKEARQAVMAIEGVKSVEIKMDSDVPNDGRMRGLVNMPIRNAIAVGSGKGGVGKSTVAVNLAVALAQSGARVGLMDADIYGPNIPRMMGVSGAPPVVREKIVPLEAHGVKLISLGMMIEPDQPAIWRGPIVMKIINQFLQDVAWGQLDYLIVDMPPGTGDAQLSLVQATQVDGAIIVTTPQEVSVGDALRGAKMFQRVGVPVLGIVENMSWFECPHCGKPSALFGSGGGERLAAALELPLLGQIPLYPRVLEGGDAGTPIVTADASSSAAKALTAIASKIASLAGAARAG